MFVGPREFAKHMVITWKRMEQAFQLRKRGHVTSMYALLFLIVSILTEQVPSDTQHKKASNHHA